MCLAQKTVPRLIVTVACTTLLYLYVGLFALQLMVDSDGSVFTWVRTVLLIVIATIAIVSITATVLRIRRVRGFIPRHRDVLDAPIRIPGDTD